MTAALLLSFVVSTAIGALLLRLVWPRPAGPCPWPLGVTLGAGLGAGGCAVLLFPWMVAVGPTRGFLWAEAILLVLVVAATLARGRGPAPHPTSGDGGGWSRWRLLLVAAFVMTLGAAAAAFGATLRRHPHGEWDAWMNWDLRARMIFRGGEGWQAAFASTFPWSHPDYPALLPSLVVRSWLYAGETLLGPALVAAIFTFGTVALLVAALAALRNIDQGLVAGLLLLSTPFFILHGTTLYADVPLGFFFLAAIVSLALDARHGAETSRFALLAGVAAGLAMWTKNEGLLFTLALGAGLLVTGWRRDRAATRRRLLAFGAGLLPLVLLVAAFKIGFGQPNDLLSTLGVQRTLGNLTSPARYYLTLREYVSHIALFGSNGVGSAVWVLAACLLGFGVNRRELGRPWVRAVVIAFVLIMAGHYAVFVSMAHELARLLASSLDRLLLQLWPSALFLFFMVCRAPEVSRAAEEAAGTRSAS
jgi:hypothetical protein